MEATFSLVIPLFGLTGQRFHVSTVHLTSLIILKDQNILYAFISQWNVPLG